MIVETVFLDAGGVLVGPNWRRVSEALARAGIAVDWATLARADPHARFDVDAPEQVAASDDAARGPYYFARILHHAGVRADAAALAPAWAEIAAYHAQHSLWEAVLDGTVAGLERLRAADLRLVVVSNANGRLGVLFDRLDLTRFFDVLIDSTVEGVEKPDPRIFARALERSGARRETTLHVGDLYHVDVVGARLAGLRPVLFDPLGLYADRDCPRVASLAELADAIARGAV